MTDKSITAEEATGICGLCGKLLIMDPNNPKLDLPFLVRSVPEEAPDSPGIIVHRSCALPGKSRS